MNDPENNKTGYGSLRQNITPEIISQLNSGNQAAFDQIYHAYYVYLCSIAVYYVHDHDIASEIVNDIFLSLWQHREYITFPILGYLRRSVQNSAISYLRSHMYKSGTLLLNDEKLWQYVSDTITSTDDPFVALSDNDLYQFIREQIEQLPPRCRSIFKACMYEGKSYQEIANQEGLSASTVRVQMKNAIAKLRDRINIPLWLILFLVH